MFRNPTTEYYSFSARTILYSMGFKYCPRIIVKSVFAMMLNSWTNLRIVFLGFSRIFSNTNITMTNMGLIGRFIPQMPTTSIESSIDTPVLLVICWCGWPFFNSPPPHHQFHGTHVNPVLDSHFTLHVSLTNLNLYSTTTSSGNDWNDTLLSGNLSWTQFIHFVDWTTTNPLPNATFTMFDVCNILSAILLIGFCLKCLLLSFVIILF